LSPLDIWDAGCMAKVRTRMKSGFTIFSTEIWLALVTRLDPGQGGHREDGGYIFPESSR
jgi:hypothetical protein